MSGPSGAGTRRGQQRGEGPAGEGLGGQPEGWRGRSAAQEHLTDLPHACGSRGRSPSKTSGAAIARSGMLIGHKMMRIG